MNTLGYLRLMGTGLDPKTSSLLPKYNSAGTSSPEARLFMRSSLRSMLAPDDNEFVYRHIPSVRDAMIVKGCCVDTIAAFTGELSVGEQKYESWLPWLKSIPILKGNDTILKLVSVVSLAFAKGTASLVVLIAALTLLGYPQSLTNFFGKSSGHSYISISTLGLPETDPAFPAYNSGSSNWLQDYLLIYLADYIKQTLHLAMKTSTASTTREGQPTTRVEKIDSFWRTLIGNQTAEGAIPPADWADRFNVILNEPAFLPQDNAVLNDSSSLASEIKRARSYVQPFFEALDRSLENRKLFITSRGMLGVATTAARKGDMICVFLGCSFPVVLRGPRKSDSDFNRVRLGDGEYGFDSVMHGSAYLSGYVEGRAVIEMTDGKLETKSFRLH